MCLRRELTDLTRWRPLIISEMQRKLATWAATDPSLRDSTAAASDNTTRMAGWSGADHAFHQRAHTGVDGVNKTMLQARLAVELQILGMNCSQATTSPCPPDGFTSLKATANCDHWVSRVCGIVLFSGPCWWRWSRYGRVIFIRSPYGFRPERSVHHAIRTVKLQLTDLWWFRDAGWLKATCPVASTPYIIDCWWRLYAAGIKWRTFLDSAVENHQGGTCRCRSLSGGQWRCTTGRCYIAIIENIMLNEFDQYLHERYLSGKARKDRRYWNNSIQRGRSNGGQRKLAMETRGGVIAAMPDDFVLIVKGTKAQGGNHQGGREMSGCSEGSLKLRLNMDKTKNHPC